MGDFSGSDNRVYILNSKDVYLIMAYYIFMFILGVILFGITIYLEYLSLNIIPSTVLAIIGCAGTSILGSIIYYIRKLYLISIRNSFAEYSKGNGTQRFGTIIYFIIRPWFAVVICVVIVLGLSVGIFAFFITDGTLSPFFVDFTMVITFFLGVSNGQLNDKIGKIGQSFINKILD